MVYIIDKVKTAALANVAATFLDCLPFGLPFLATQVLHVSVARNRCLPFGLPFRATRYSMYRSFMIDDLADSLMGR